MSDGRKKKPVVPKLRFPEFRDAGPWEVKRLGDIASIIQDRAGSKECILLSVTAGVGLVSQIEKFGEEIAGGQRKNYFAIRSNDFAYNKSATKDYPQGFIGLYKGDCLAGVPNSIFTCFRPRIDKVVPSYLDYLFSANFHGKWLSRFITVGARAHGSLNIDNKDLLSMPIPIPNGDKSQLEQQKIADCLSSLDELIELQSQKIEALKQHKKGLTQQLFPQEGETTPNLRFPEFRDAGPWEVKRLGDIASIIQDRAGSKECILLSVTAGVGLVSQIEKFGEEIAGGQRKNYFAIRSNDFAYNKSATKDYPQGFIGLYKGDCLAGVPNSIFTCFRPRIDKVVPSYLDYLFSANFHGKWLSRFITVGARAHGSLNIDNKDLLSMPIPIPNGDKSQLEQQKIADCLSSLDELIELQSQKIEALKQHKKGLTQQLFPQEVDQV